MQNEKHEIEKISTSKYYFTQISNGIKKFTETMCMKAIVNGFISVMPVIIVASIFTLITSLPEMVIAVGWGEQTLKFIQDNTCFGDFQFWGQTISNWSMGVLGVFATVAISKNMAVFLNEKLPFERKINEMTIIFAAISVYLLLSVIEFTVNPDVISSTDHVGRAIFVDGLAAQGILPGILIALSMPWIFYWAMKYNWTIRLPKQVPQTISQAFIAIIPLFIVLGIYGSIGFALNIVLGAPVLFWLFEQIQKALTANDAINNSYGLIAAYTFMEGGFWFLGVHPEPVHAIMRSTFWFDNINANANHTGNNIFIEPYMYGFGAMGGSGCTLAIPYLCLLFGKSNQMKLVGKTGWLPIIFQVNEPVLFSAPCILNPVFFIPMIFTGMANDMIFKAIADATNFTAGSLYLPWSTPFFLQTALGTPLEFQVWLMNILALVISFGMYAPFVIIQDKMYVNEDVKKLGINIKQYHSETGISIVKQKLFLIDFESSLNRKKYKLNLKEKIKTQKEEYIIKINSIKKEINNLKNKKTNIHDDVQKLNKQIKSIKKDYIKEINQIKINKKQDLLNIKIKNIPISLKNLLTFSDKMFENKIISIKNNAHSSTDTINLVMNDKKKNKNNKKNKLITKIENLEKNIEIFKNINSSYILKKQEELNDNNLKISNFWTKFYKTKIEKIQDKIVKNQKKLNKFNSNIKISVKKDPDLIYAKKYVKALLKKEKYNIKIVNKFIKKQSNFKNKYPKLVQEIDTTIYEKYINSKKLIININKQCQLLLSEAQKKHKDNLISLSKGIDPWEIKLENNKSEKSLNTKSTNNNEQKIYNILVLCLGAGSSAVLANTIKTGLKQKGLNNFTCSALAWGSHESALKNCDLVILSPQMGANAKSMENASKELGFKFVATRGKEYIDLSRDPIKAAEFALEKLEIKE